MKSGPQFTSAWKFTIRFNCIPQMEGDILSKFTSSTHINHLKT